MTDFSEAVRAAVGSEWMTTKEIADSVPDGPKNKERGTYRHLWKLWKYGIVEHKTSLCSTGWTAYWRLRA